MGDPHSFVLACPLIPANKNCFFLQAGGGIPRFFCNRRRKAASFATQIKKALTDCQSLVELTHPNANIFVFMGGFGININVHV